uniref:Uncharacterized protein n=1 Tax=Rhizophora mucronata TaxID=61149 RepID=A0A2P2PZY1_RHIMU
MKGKEEPTILLLVYTLGLVLFLIRGVVCVVLDKGTPWLPCHILFFCTSSCITFCLASKALARFMAWAKLGGV